MNRDRDTERSKQKLISMGKQKGYVTYDEVNDAMPDEIVSSDQIDDWLSTLGDEGIEVVDGQGPGGGVKVPTARVTPKLPEVAAYSRRRGERGGRRRQRREGEREGRVRRGLRGLLEDQRPGAHVPAQDGLGLAAHARRRGRDRQAHRGGRAARPAGRAQQLDRRRGDPRARQQPQAGRRSASRTSSATSTRRTPSSTRSGTPIASSS